MGNARSKVVRASRRFNIENRASKALDKQHKPVNPLLGNESSNRTKQMLDNYYQVQRGNPEFDREEEMKDIKLLDHLKKVRVESFGPPPPMLSATRPLPGSRENTEGFAFERPEVVPDGKISLGQFVKLVTDHAADPNVYTVEYLANEHKLKIEHVRHLVQHYGTLVKLQVTPSTSESTAKKKVVIDDIMKKLGDYQYKYKYKTDVGAQLPVDLPGHMEKLDADLQELQKSREKYEKEKE